MVSIKLANFNGKPEIFHSVQGEGKNMGRPSVFIRTSLCNLHCVWCDTDYTWNWQGTRFKHVRDKDPAYRKFDIRESILEVPVSEIYEPVAQSGCQNVVLTGGEPMLQQDELAQLMQYFRERDPRYFFEVETNGTILPHFSFDKSIDQYNVSPKLANSGNARKLREKPGAYRFFSQSEKAVFKFVVAGPEDLGEVLELMEKYAIDPRKTYLMPEGTTRAALNEKQIWLVEICKRYQFNYTDRLHIHIFGDKRGV